MAVLSITAAQVRPLNGAIIRRFIAGETVNVGDAVYVDTDGTVSPADANGSLATAQARGIVVGVGVAGSTSAASGQAVDVATHGAVALGTSGMTDGAVVYVSATAGKLDQAAPSETGDDWDFVIGWAESDSVLYVQPQVIVPSAS